MNANDRFEAALAAVTQLDLTPIKGKLMHAASGEGWTLEKANAVEREYRRFLCLSVAFPDESIVPLVDVDTFWHYHILDTMKYAADCEQAFGYFLHHCPYLGLGDEEDEQVRIDTGERTLSLYQAMFGEAYADAALESGAAFCAGPGARDTVQAGTFAFCAGPGARDTVQAGTFAFCAGPGARDTVQAGTFSFCAGPGARDTVQAGTFAFCAGPGAKHPVKAGAMT